MTNGREAVRALHYSVRYPKTLLSIPVEDVNSIDHERKGSGVIVRNAFQSGEKTLKLWSTRA
jgi:hypothetical protein